MGIWDLWNYGFYSREGLCEYLDRLLLLSRGTWCGSNLNPSDAYLSFSYNLVLYERSAPFALGETCISTSRLHCLDGAPINLQHAHASRFCFSVSWCHFIRCRHFGFGDVDPFANDPHQIVAVRSEWIQIPLHKRFPLSQSCCQWKLPSILIML